MVIEEFGILLAYFRTIKIAHSIGEVHFLLGFHINVKLTNVLKVLFEINLL